MLVLQMLCLTTFAFQSGPSKLDLWYEQPASNWNEALPVGNGRLGAMVFGGVYVRLK